VWLINNVKIIIMKLNYKFFRDLLINSPKSKNIFKFDEEEKAINNFIDYQGYSKDKCKREVKNANTKIDLLIDDSAFEFVTGDNLKRILYNKILNVLQNGNYTSLNKKQNHIVKNKNIISNLTSEKEVLDSIKRCIYKKEKQLTKYAELYNNVYLIIYFFESFPSTIYTNNPDLLIPHLTCNSNVNKIIKGIYIQFSKEYFYFNSKANEIHFKPL